MSEHLYVPEEPTVDQQSLPFVNSLESFHSNEVVHNNIVEGIPENCINSSTEVCEPVVDNRDENNIDCLSMAEKNNLIDKELKIDDLEKKTDDIIDNTELIDSENTLHQTDVEATSCMNNSSVMVEMDGAITVSNSVQETITENVNAIIEISTDETDPITKGNMTSKFKFIFF